MTFERAIVVPLVVGAIVSAVIIIVLKPPHGSGFSVGLVVGICILPWLWSRLNRCDL